MAEEPWVLPEIPTLYWVNELCLRCQMCGAEFEILVPNGNELVKLREAGGTAFKWLPVYESGGYLDLLTRVVPGWTLDSEITMQIASQFEQTLWPSS